MQEAIDNFIDSPAGFQRFLSQADFLWKSREMMSNKNKNQFGVNGTQNTLFSSNGYIREG